MKTRIECAMCKSVIIEGDPDSITQYSICQDCKKPKKRETNEQ